MFRNHFKIAVRNLLRGKVFSIINISGLAIGMASAILILLWVQNEMSYDKFHANANRLYEVYLNDKVDNSMHSLLHTPKVMASFLKNNIPEIEQVSRVSWDKQFLLAVGEKSLMATENTVDPSFLSMFSFPLLKGDIKTALNDPNSIVLTEKLAKKLFGNEDAMGKVVRLENSDDLKVTGILKDLPNNTQFNFEYLASYSSNEPINGDWTVFSIRTFVLLKPNTSVDAVNKKIKNLIVQQSGGQSKATSLLYPITKLRLYSGFENDKAVGGRIETVRVFILIAVLILLIACINFMNLSTARSGKRAKEVGIRKVAGARKKSLVGQFLAESILLSLIAGVAALLIVQFCLPAFNDLVQKQLFIDYGDLKFWFAAIGFILFTGILAGSYPAFFLSAFKPVSVLKGTFKKVNALVTPRKVLVVLQFTFAIALIVCTMIVEQQLKYAQSRETGYDKYNLGYINLRSDLLKNYGPMKNELLETGVATEITLTQRSLTQNWFFGASVINWQGKDPNLKIQINQFSEDGDLVKTAGMQLMQGRDIDVKNFSSDSSACLLSESTVKMMGFKNPIGQVISYNGDEWHVVGVIKDFIIESPYEPIKPFMAVGPKYGGTVMHIKLNNTNAIKENLANAERIFKKYYPAYPFEFHFIDKEYEQKFNNEQLIGTFVSLFAFLTIFISCLGLFGLVAYMAESRIKEIGVRKVLGASVKDIVLLLSTDFVKLVLIAFVIAAPIAWIIMNKWLQGYAYRININGWVFIITALISLGIAIVTVSFQTIKAAVTNPVDNLRTE